MTSGWTSAASVQGLAQAGRKLGPRGQAHLMPSPRDDTPSPPTSRAASRVPSYAWMETVRRAAHSFSEPRPSSPPTVIDNKTFHSIMPSILQDESEDTRNSREDSQERPGSANNSDHGMSPDHLRNHDFDHNYDGPNRSSQSSIEINLSSRNHPDPANRLRANKPTIRFS